MATKEQQAQYRADYPEKARASARKYYAKNAEVLKQKQHTYYAAHAEEEKAKRREYAKTEKKKAYERARSLRRYHGITVDDFQRMSEQQSHSCKICKKQGLLVVDHCHKTGVIRGLLCGNCNTGLGQFKDDPASLAAAIQYLKDAP